MTIEEIIKKTLNDGGHAPDEVLFKEHPQTKKQETGGCLLYTSDAADE